MQQAVHSTHNVSQLIKLDCKRVEPHAYMQKLTHFIVSKNDITKFMWGRLGGIALTTFWPWGRSPPSPPWSRRLWPLCQISCKSVHGGFSANTWNITEFFYLYIHLYSPKYGRHMYTFLETHLQVRPLDGFSRAMSQTTRSYARVCLLGVKI